LSDIGPDVKLGKCRDSGNWYGLSWSDTCHHERDGADERLFFEEIQF